MNRGDVIHIPEYQFQDGGKANKLLVLLNDPNACDKVFCVLTTSQETGNRKKDNGCQPVKQEFFIKAGREFEKDTWILLNRQAIVIPVTRLKETIDQGKASVVFTLSEKRVNEIKNCLARNTSCLTREHCAMLGVNFMG